MHYYQERVNQISQFLWRLTFETLFHLRLHTFIHLDERRPGAFETFAGNFLRRVNAQLAAAGDFARRMVEHVGRAFGEEAVALWVSVGGEMEQHLAGVVNVHVGVHHHDVFGPAVAGSSAPCP